MPRATLSDLLADDIKDYFRREGVNDNLAQNGASHKQKRRRMPNTAASNNTLSTERSGVAPAHTQLAQEQPGRSNQQQHRRRLSSGSDSQRNSHITAQDAEFLKRYAEEKERASRIVHKADESRDISAPKDLITKDVVNTSGSNSKIKTNKMRPYQTLAASPRPPSVTGSHRPQLPSIDNDDWEEDDRLERKEQRKIERRRKRSGLSSDGHVRRPSSASGGHLRKISGASTLSYGNGSNYNGHWRMSSSNNSFGSGSFVRHYQQPLAYPGVQYSPGETLCYSTSSHSNLPTPGMDSIPTFMRKQSDDTFVRKESDDTFAGKESAALHSSSPLGNGDNARGHVRPLSYLSASSESEQKSEVNSPSLGPSPLSSGTFKTLPSDRYSFRSKDSESLWGGSIILESSSPGSEKPQPYRHDYRFNRQESSEDSSDDESYSSSSDETTDSGYNHVTFSEKDRLISKHKSYSSLPRRPYKRPKVSPLRLDDAIKVIWDRLWSAFVLLELYISNMPSLIGSLALAWSTLGVDWFKWYEETFDACHPTDYHSKLCTYPEFPGCFTCDTGQIGYQFTLRFHYLCSTISLVLSVSLIGKIIIAFPVVRDELANPTTAAPLGLLCMALEKIFGGNFGAIGMSFVFGASALQTIVAIWFIFISIIYKTLPEPSWFPNTTGLGLAAAKIYLYWSFGGYMLSVLSVILFIMFYFVALYRIHHNYKISAPVCWVQLSGPAVVLYGVSIFGQPGSDEAEIELASSQENIEHFTMIHRMFYMPILHFLFVCCMVSMVSALYCLSIRFRRFREKEFSPAHVAFCAPILSHSNALQVYRSAVKRFTSLPRDHLFKEFLYQYWTLCLISGTVLSVVMTFKFITHLPTWCRIDTDDDEIPPEPEHTMLTKLLEKGDAKDEITQNYVSAAVLQANESGALVRVLRDGKMKYMRSRRMPSMGFDPIMSNVQLTNERERLLQHVKYAASLRDREHGTSSFDDTLSSFYERSSSRASSTSSSSSLRRNRNNFMSFDASAMMRGEH